MNYTSSEYVNFLYALDNGWTGKDVLVAVIDDGAVETDELKGQFSPLSKDFGRIIDADGVHMRNGPIGDEKSDHGTPVAAIIAGKRNGEGPVGFASDAKLVILRVDSYDSLKGEERYGDNGSAALRYAIDNGVKIINRSSGSKNIDIANTTDQRDAQYAKDHGALIVNSAGNSSGERPQDWLAATETNKEAWLFVAALNPNGTNYQLAGYSNQCGVSRDRCVAAVGGQITTDVNGKLTGFGGTSSAAPQASALAALILGKWPQLSGVDAGNVILSTAKDIGDPGVDDVFGHGLIDFKAALSPINPTLSNGVTTSSVQNSVMVVGDAFGGVIQTALNDVTILDSYGRDFTGDISSMVIKPAANGHWLRRRMESQANAGGTGFITPQMSASIGFTSFRTGPGDDEVRGQLTNAQFAVRSGDTHIIAGFNSGDNVQDDVLGLAPSSDAMFAYSPLANVSFGATRPFGDGRLGLQMVGGQADNANARGVLAQWVRKDTAVKVGLLDESGTVFGTPVGLGALRFGNGASTAFVEASANTDVGDWNLSGYASIGMSQLKIGNDTLLTDASAVTTTRFGLMAARALFDGKVSFGVAQPLMALNGQGTITAGSGYDLASQSLLFSNRTVELGGQMMPRLSIGYEQAGERSSFRVGAAGNANGHDIRAVTSWTHSF